jgi:Carboxypeptidase regulatory-like domain
VCRYLCKRDSGVDIAIQCARPAPQPIGSGFSAGAQVDVTLAEGETKVIDVRTGPVGKLRGVVRTPNGKPLAGAIVSGEGCCRSTTDAQGRYEVFQFPTSTTYDIVVIPPTGLGLSQTRVKVAITVGTTTVKDLAVLKAASVVGKVTDPNGRPAAGVAVSLGERATTTDAKGKYEFTEVNVDIDSYTMWFRPSGVGAISARSGVKVEAGKKTDVDLTLKRPGTLRIRAVDPTGARCAGVRRPMRTC